MDRGSGTTVKKSLLKAWGDTKDGVRNTFYYRDAFYTLVRVVNLQAVVILVLAVMVGWHIKTSHNEDGYFAEMSDGRQMPLAGLERPYMTKEAKENWVAAAVSEVMTFGFNDVNEKMGMARRHFTPEGWGKFYKALVAGKLVNIITEQQQIVTAVPATPPNLIYEGLSNGKYIWMYDMQLMVTFRAGSAKQNSTKSVRVTVEEVPTSDNPIGLGISEWYIY